MWDWIVNNYQWLLSFTVLLFVASEVIVISVSIRMISGFLYGEQGRLTDLINQGDRHSLGLIGIRDTLASLVDRPRR